MYSFTCNVCCAPCSLPSTADLAREEKNCLSCGSTVRFRWIVHALSEQLYGISIPLTFFPIDKSVRGLGMSDWHVIAEKLSLRLSFCNTFLHTEPMFDLRRPGADDWGAFDFVIASEVFEHITPPVQPAFDNLARLLRSNGFVLFTVPWKPDGATVEHFSSLHDWKIVDKDKNPVLINRTAAGVIERFENVALHGGDGQTLEMRFFSRADLIRRLQQAGLADITFSRVDEKPEFGVVWEGNYSLGLVARKRRGRFRLWGWPYWKVRIRWLIFKLGLQSFSYVIQK